MTDVALQINSQSATVASATKEVSNSVQAASVLAKESETLREAVTDFIKG